MIPYEYKVIPAPAKGRKSPGIKGPEARFAHTIEMEINALAAKGWEYLRTDILPSEERQGLTSTQTVYRSLLVFRRPVDESIQTDHEATEVSEPPAAIAPSEMDTPDNDVPSDREAPAEDEAEVEVEVEDDPKGLT